jgi:peptidoglycan/LPS O-acetylase OafA/YrhL
LYGLFLGVFLLVAFRPAFSLLSSPPLLFLGAISYSLYLLHMTIGRAIADEVYATTGSVALSLGAAVAAVVALATLVTYGFERPSQRHLRARLRLNRPNRGGDSLSPRSRPAEARSGS